MMTSQNKGVTPVSWRSRPTPHKRKQKQQRPAAGVTRRGRGEYLRDLLKLLVPVATFVALAAPEDDEGEGETKKGGA